MKREIEIVTLKNGETVTLTETETQIEILAIDWGASGAFGARLAIASVLFTRAEVIRAFEAVCESLDIKAKGEGEARKTETEDFATALCNLLCEIENEGGGSESVSKARAEFETAARVAYEKEGGETLKAVIEQFDIFADIG